MSSKPLSDKEILQYLEYLDENEDECDDSESDNFESSDSDSLDIEILPKRAAEKSNLEESDPQVLETEEVDDPPPQDVPMNENVRLDPNDLFEGMYQ